MQKAHFQIWIDIEGRLVFVMLLLTEFGKYGAFGMSILSALLFQTVYLKDQAFEY